MGLFDSLTTMVGLTSATTTTPAQAEGPLTLGKWLEQNQKTPQNLMDDSFLLARAVRALLKDKNITSPTKHQLHETRFALASAIKSGKHTNFVCPITPGIIDVELGNECCPGNVFYEREAYSSTDLTPDALQLTRYNTKRLDQGYSNGLLGQIVAGTFISGRNRSSNDFSHVYGDEPWACYIRTWNMLDSIPKGEFLDKLDLDLVTETNRLIHAADPRKVSQFYRAMGALTRGRADVAGRIRDGQTITQMYTFTHDEITNLEEVGIAFHGLPSFGGNTRRGVMHYPSPETIRPRIEELIAELKTEAAKEEGADIIGAAAKFCRQLIALHPYEDSNGRTARAIMNRILMDFGYAPAILSHADSDLTMGEANWKTEVLEGIAHTKRYLDKSEVYANDALLGKEKISIPGTNKSTSITIAGFPFGQGGDGFLYDVTGRPYLLDGDILKPLSQLEYYSVARRFITMEKYQAVDKLKELTQATRELVEKLKAGEVSAEDYSVEDDITARNADSEYGIRGDSFVLDALIDLMDITLVDNTKLFRVYHEKGTPASSLMSKYSQLDLEHWQIESAMAKAGNKEGAAKVRTHREALFNKAKQELEGLKQADLQTETNPDGFQVEYEKTMYAASTLRFDTLSDAIAADGDDSITIWRGDYAFARALGMAPNNDPRQPAAREHTKANYERHVVPHLLQELKALERSGVGSHYLSHTTDLSLLTGNFAKKVKSTTIRLDSLPRPVAWGLEAWMGQPSTADAVAAPSAMAISIGDILGVPGDILGIKRGRGRTLEIQATRKAFEMKVPKNSILPGMVTLSPNHAFANEQEVHGLEKVGPLSIRATYTADQLAEKTKKPIEVVAEEPTHIDVPAPSLEADVALLDAVA